MKVIIRCVAVLMLGVSTVVAAQGTGPHYRIELLPNIGPDRFTPYDINNLGTVVGSRVFVSQERVEAFLYQGGTVRMLGTLGGRISEAVEINERGDVVGVSTVKGDEIGHAFFYGDNRMREIPSPSGSEPGFAAAYAISNSGLVAGTARRSLDHQARPYVYDGVKSSFIDSPENFFGEEPAAINDRGDVVGTSFDRAYYYHDNVTRLLPLPGDQDPNLVHYWMSGRDINNAGQMIVTFRVEEAVSYIYSDGQYTRLDRPRFQAVDINELGWVIGWSGPRNRRPTFYKDGTFYDINSRILRGDDKDLKILDVQAMNDLGQIIGTSTAGAFIATPVPEPGTWMLTLAGMGVIGAAVRRRRRDVAAPAQGSFKLPSRV